ncbi:hypothetical protein [Streptomyces omiyaensis]|uniref:Uncharacterized protein n=1 Tax=Streptomyces omiyaensis TaxID=68247 RepID=A0ABW7C5A4_9ACTN
MEELVGEAQRLLRHRTWIPTSAERVVAGKAATELHAAVGDPRSQLMLSEVDRLAHLREALAALAIGLAHVHGRLAWFLGATVTALTPILHWRALPVDDGLAFGTVRPTLQQYEEAEEAVRRLRAALAGIATA